MIRRTFSIRTIDQRRDGGSGGRSPLRDPRERSVAVFFSFLFRGQPPRESPRYEIERRTRAACREARVPKQSRRLFLDSRASRYSRRKPGLFASSFLFAIPDAMRAADVPSDGSDLATLIPPPLSLRRGSLTMFTMCHNVRTSVVSSPRRALLDIGETPGVSRARLLRNYETTRAHSSCLYLYLHICIS